MAGLAWLLMVILTSFSLPESLSSVINLVLGVLLVVMPIVNHVGMFIAIRRHNNQVVDVVAEQNLSILFKREKKAAIDMIIVIAVLMFCVTPIIVLSIFQQLIGAEEYELLYSWSVAIVYINSSINPVIYLGRNSEIRNAIRSIMSC